MIKLKIPWMTIPFALIPLISPAQDAEMHAAVTTKVRSDPAHPVRLGENYPAESKRRNEEGMCKVRLTVTADGTVHDVTLTKSTGYSRLDQACLEAFVHGGLLPATQNGVPVTTTLERRECQECGD
jgi:protein TonB